MSNEDIYKSIASDHLKEFGDYYTRLAKMEAEAKASTGKKESSQGTWLKKRAMDDQELIQRTMEDFLTQLNSGKSFMYHHDISKPLERLDRAWGPKGAVVIYTGEGNKWINLESRPYQIIEGELKKYPEQPDRPLADSIGVLPEEESKTNSEVTSSRHPWLKRAEDWGPVKESYTPSSELGPSHFFEEPSDDIKKSAEYVAWLGDKEKLNKDIEKVHLTEKYNGELSTSPADTIFLLTRHFGYPDIDHDDEHSSYDLRAAVINYILDNFPKSRDAHDESGEERKRLRDEFQGDIPIK
jgi:hypothetical protein